MAKGFLIESSIRATDVVALNRYAVSSTADFDGGNLVALSAPTEQGNDVWTATVPSDKLGGLYVAYNPSMHITVDGNGEYAGLSKDPRDYTNTQGRVFTVFKPEVGDIFVISADCVDSTGTSAVDGDILESKAGQSTWTRVAKATGATSGSTATQIMHKVVIPFPATKGKIGFSKQTGYKVEVVQA